MCTGSKSSGYPAITGKRFPRDPTSWRSGYAQRAVILPTTRQTSYGTLNVIWFDALLSTPFASTLFTSYT
jgi:hypothetical protein